MKAIFNNINRIPMEFRAYAKNGNRLGYPAGMVSPSVSEFNPIGDEIDNLAEEGVYVMMWTGLYAFDHETETAGKEDKDKIYVGDIVQEIGGGTQPYVITLEAGGFFARSLDNIDKRRELPEKMMITGNIFEVFNGVGGCDVYL